MLPLSPAGGVWVQVVTGGVPEVVQLGVPGVGVLPSNQLIVLGETLPS